MVFLNRMSPLFSLVCKQITLVICLMFKMTRGDSMKSFEKTYDVAVIGGGLYGLTASLELARFMMKLGKIKSITSLTLKLH